MALEVLHQQAATHENEQFRRVVKIVDAVFKKRGYDGILVGNPFNENYRRFRADAILLFNHGVVIIDFKDYSGQLIIPRGDDEFKSYPWYAEKALDHQAIEVKAGPHAPAKRNSGVSSAQQARMSVGCRGQTTDTLIGIIFLLIILQVVFGKLFSQISK